MLRHTDVRSALALTPKADLASTLIFKDQAIAIVCDCFTHGPDMRLDFIVIYNFSSVDNQSHRFTCTAIEIMNMQTQCNHFSLCMKYDYTGA